LPVVLGVTCSWDDDNKKYYLNSLYARGIVAAGGIPFIIPDCLSKKEVQKLPALLSGVLLSGGGDVDPAFFGEEPLPACGKIAPERDAFEIELVRMCLAENLPVLGICRGAQIINIAAGGDIYQDINTQLKGSLQHNQKAPYWAPTHNIMIQKGTLLEAILGEKSIRVNSFHHQSVRNPAPGFFVSARSGDGVIEAIESTTHPFAIGVQCHPEGMWERDLRFLELFRSLVKAGSKKS
jgi:putative glutamine amidotransferase